MSETKRVIMVQRSITLSDWHCAHCHAPFVGPVQRRYCSVACQRRAAYERQKAAHGTRSGKREQREW